MVQSKGKIPVMAYAVPPWRAVRERVRNIIPPHSAKIFPQMCIRDSYQLSYCRISKTETKVIYIFQPTKYKQTIFTITIKISALLFISTALCISCVWINRSLSLIHIYIKIKTILLYSWMEKLITPKSVLYFLTV